MAITNHFLDVFNALAWRILNGLKKKMVLFAPISVGVNDDPMSFDQAVERAMQASEKSSL